MVIIVKALLTGNEAIARGAWEAGVLFASAYPGTPSTEILETLAGYKDIEAEWAPNEKVAVEAALGASIAGARSIAAMKHVGLNVAADPLFTFAYTGVNGGMALISADEPGQHSSQNEQDNRHYAKAMRIPMLEPSDSQECKDMVGTALTLSEQFDTPVLIRTTTRVNHSKSIVEQGEPPKPFVKAYTKDPGKFVCVPSNARRLRARLETRTAKLLAYAETSSLNLVQQREGSPVGVIASGVCFYYAKEVFGDTASYLKLGFTWPLPAGLIRRFCEAHETVYIIEETDPYIEEAVCMLGFGDKVRGKSLLPRFGELSPDLVREACLGQSPASAKPAGISPVPRPPVLCAGCPHRGFFYELGKTKNIMVAGDIGCYTLAYAEPYNAMDFTICMGASFSAGHGAQKVFRRESNRRVVAVLGDSTFFHTGINSLVEVVYNNSNTVCVVLDNATTGMTGHQNNPGTGFNARGEIACRSSIEGAARAIGIKHIAEVNPNKLAEVRNALDTMLALDEPSLIIARWPCVLKRGTPAEQAAFPRPFSGSLAVDPERCTGCGLCLKCGCPALSVDAALKKARIDAAHCAGCTVCQQICPGKAVVQIRRNKND
jgi:indolepyruvate ferredoxin oxidoreductase alpha subunit